MSCYLLPFQIAACFADRGKDFGGDPAAETLCRGKLAGEDQGIEAGFVDQYTRGSVDGERIVHRSVLAINVVTDGLLGVAVAQGLGYVFADKPGLAGKGDGTDGAELRALKRCNIKVTFW